MFLHLENVIVSTGGLHNAVLEAVDIGAKAFGMFLKSQRQWNSKPMEEEAAKKFREACEVVTGFCCAASRPKTWAMAREKLRVVVVVATQQ